MGSSVWVLSESLKKKKRFPGLDRMKSDFEENPFYFKRGVGVGVYQDLSPLV